MSKVILSTANFELVVEALAYEGPAKGQLGYRIRNKRTGVFEAEGIHEDGGIRAIHAFEADLQRVLADPTGEGDVFGGPVPPGVTIN